MIKRVLTSLEAQAVDKKAIGELGVSGTMLMEMAGKGAGAEAFKICRENDIDTVQIFCGKGNNGGDGYVCALDLYEKGIRHVEIIAFSLVENIKGDALVHYNRMRELGIITKHINSSKDLKACLKDHTLWIDAVFGTGLRKAVQGEFAKILECLVQEHGDQPVLAMDIPSGLDAGSGKVLGSVLRASVTVTMGFYKSGLFLNKGKFFCGRIHLVDLPYPEAAYSVCENDTFLCDEEEVKKRLHPIPIDGHKYNMGQVLACGGSAAMPGAITLGAEAALRSGAGIVKVLTAGSAVKTVQNLCRELIVLGGHRRFIQKQDILKIRSEEKRSGSCLLGPGLGRKVGSKKFVEEALKLENSMVIDADGLFHLNVEQLRARSYETVITPHWGEFSRLSGIKSRELSENTVNYARKFAQLAGCTLHLKSYISLTALPDGTVYFHVQGCAGMATAGSGDVLAGLIAGLMAQGHSGKESTLIGVYVHQLAGKAAADRLGNRSMTASDILESVPRVLKSLEVAN